MIYLTNQRGAILRQFLNDIFFRFGRSVFRRISILRLLVCLFCCWGWTLTAPFAPSMASPSAGNSGSDPVTKSYAQAVNKKVENSSFKISMRFPVDINGEMGFIFSESEMVKAAEEFRYALVMKFMRFRPSIDKIRLNVVKTWGLQEISTISFMDDYHVLIHMKSERDFVHGWAHEGRKNNGG